MNRLILAASLLAATALSLAAGAPVAVAAPATCSGKTVARADINGDGRRDTVTVTQVARGDNPRFRLCVRTASGKVASVVDTPYTFLGSRAPFFGVAGMDGQRGNEVVLRSGYGAHSTLFHVYTWRSGRLVAMNAPDTRDREWYVDSAATIVEGYRFYTSRGTRYVTATIAFSSVMNNSPYTGAAKTYRWQRGAWVHHSTKRISVDNARSGTVYGWHGLPLNRD